MVEFKPLDECSGKFLVSPLEKGMGVTVGNAMRRVLLSSLSGFAVTKVKIDGVSHEFSTIPNVVEDVLDIISNLKSLIFVSNSDDAKVFSITGKGKGVLTANDIKLDGSTTVKNNDQHILEMSKSANVNIEITVEKGVGYQPSVDVDELGVISVDASFSPIVKVNHKIENIRVGKEMGYDSLELDIFTDGSISVDDAAMHAARHLISRFSLFDKINEKPVLDVEETGEASDSNQEATLALTVDDLELSARSSNCLKRAGIQSVSELIQMDMVDLIQIKNFGKKSAEEINEKLNQYNLSLKGSVEDLVK